MDLGTFTGANSGERRREKVILEDLVFLAKTILFNELQELP
jgi:hypothetical protein